MKQKNFIVNVYGRGTHKKLEYVTLRSRFPVTEAVAERMLRMVAETG